MRQAQLDPSDVVSRWEPYQALHPPFILYRANALLSPPDTVQLSLDNGVLHARGAAPHGWIMEAARLARLIPGVAEFRHEQLVDTTLAELAVLQEQIEQEALLFRKNSTQLAPGQEEAFQRLSAAMHRLYDLAQAANAGVRVDILGHADAMGGEGKNLSLSQERADQLLSALAAQGLAKVSLAAIGVGSKNPRSDEATEDARALNRRVSFRVILTWVDKR